MAGLGSLHQLRPARVLEARLDAGPAPGAMLLRVETGEGERSLRARLLVAADGTRSQLRDALGIHAQEHDYGQTLFVSTVVLERAHGDVAYERFGPDGPFALLPLAGNRAGCVCTVPTARAAAVAAMDEDAYRALLQQRFGFRLGRFGRIGRRSAHALALVRAQRLHAPRAVLVGNAAQT